MQGRLTATLQKLDKAMGLSKGLARAAVVPRTHAGADKKQTCCICILILVIVALIVLYAAA